MQDRVRVCFSSICEPVHDSNKMSYASLHEGKVPLSNPEILDAEYLVWSGGSVRGISYLGAYFTLRHVFSIHGRDLRAQLKGCSGSSAGALFSLLVCLGCTDQDMWDSVVRVESEKILEDADLTTFSQEWGFNDKHRFILGIKKLLEKYTGNAEITFGELLEVTGKELSVTLARLNDSTVHYHGPRNHPDQPVWKSVAASMSIPVVFTPYRDGDDFYVDGGILDNTPIVFDMSKSIVFLLKNRDSRKITSAVSYLLGTFYLSINALEKLRIEQIDPRHRNRLVWIHTPGCIQSYHFVLSDSDKKSLVMSGARSVFYWLYPDMLSKSILESLVPVILTLGNIKGLELDHQIDPQAEGVEEEDVGGSSDPSEHTLQPEQSTQSQIAPPLQ